MAEGEGSYRARRTPGPSPGYRGGGTGDRGRSGGLNAEHEEGVRSGTHPPLGHAPASAHWWTEGVGRGLLQTNKRAPENRQRALRHCVTCRAVRLRSASLTEGPGGAVGK